MKEADKDKIMVHMKGLLSKRTKTYQTSFSFLINEFFENKDWISDGDMFGPLEQWQIIQAIFLSLIKQLIYDDDLITLATVRDLYTKLRLQVSEMVETTEELEIFTYTNDYYNQQLHIMLKQY
jgi:hypothetical protein